MSNSNQSKQIPNFEPDIPDFLLADLSDKEKWLYTSIGRSAKINEYLLEKAQNHEDKLAEVSLKQDYTNGKVLKLTAYADKNNKDLDQIIFWKRAFVNKYVLTGIGVISFICIKFPAIAALLSLLKGL